MAMSDCIDCWETPCSCGTGYTDWSINRIDEQIAMLHKVREKKIKLAFDNFKEQLKS